MFEAGALLFLFADSPIHAGSGRALGGVDLPLQRERRTDYPIIQGSGIKGMLRAAIGSARGGDARWMEEVFGPPTERASEHAGAVAVGDARLLLLPLRSLVGVYGWVTSPDVLARFIRDCRIVGVEPPGPVPSVKGEAEALVTSDALVAGGPGKGVIVLEEFTFTARIDPAASQVAQWLAENALPDGPEYEYWREGVRRRLAVLHENAFRDFARLSTEVVTRIRLDPSTKTVEEGALWTEEYLPADTLLYAPVFASMSRVPRTDRSQGSQGARPPRSGRQILEELTSAALHRVQVGGNETIGRGLAAIRFRMGGKG